LAVVVAYSGDDVDRKCPGLLWLLLEKKKRGNEITEYGI
jgi:hypothetical protein